MRDANCSKSHDLFIDIQKFVHFLSRTILLTTLLTYIVLTYCISNVQWKLINTKFVYTNPWKQWFLHENSKQYLHVFTLSMDRPILGESETHPEVKGRLYMSPKYLTTNFVRCEYNDNTACYAPIIMMPLLGSPANGEHLQKHILSHRFLYHLNQWYYKLCVNEIPLNNKSTNL